MDWSARWRGRWIWDRAPEEAFWWRSTPAEARAVYVRRVFEVGQVPPSVPARATCDSRYELYLNGRLVGRGPVRGEPEHLGWDDYDLAPFLARGTNVVVALCRYYARAGPWWLPASPLGTLGRGSFCFETAAESPIDLATGESWRARQASWLPSDRGGPHSFPPEIVDGRLVPLDLHQPRSDEAGWAPAAVLSGRGHGTVLDRPPAAPYMTPLPRPIPQLRSLNVQPTRLLRGVGVAVDVGADPAETWSTARLDERGERAVTVWDAGRICLAHVRLRIAGADRAEPGAVVDVVAGEDLRTDGLPETAPRRWAARYLTGGRESEEIAFFDPVGLRYVAAHFPPELDVAVELEETHYPRPQGARFECDDDRYTTLWQSGVRTLDVCSSDAFIDCPGREQRAWVSDAYPQTLVSLVVSPDWRLVRHHLALTARSRFPSGLLAGAAACDFARIGFTIPEYSLHWIRSVAAYWRYSGDEAFVRDLLPVADAIIERYELQRGPTGLLEEFPGWVFIDWAQLDRDVVTGAHDALYAAALEDYATLPGASDVRTLREATAAAFEALWDGERGVYVDAVGPDGRSRRVSQHTNAAALLANIVPGERVAGIVDSVLDPSGGGLGGSVVVTASPAALRLGGVPAHDVIPLFQYQAPTDFDPEIDVVACQPWFCRFVHEALFRHGRRDLVLANLLRWNVRPGDGTFQEFWDAEPGASSRCHGWSVSPTFDLTSYVLGARPLAPGYERGVVDPYLGPLRRVAGRVPTPRGWLTVAVDGEISVDVPPGMTVTVAGEEVGPGEHRLPRGEAV